MHPTSWILFFLALPAGDDASGGAVGELGNGSFYYLCG
jgi:hypothetical protein